MIILPGAMPASRPAWRAIGPWMPHCPPPEGTKRFTTPAATNDSNGIVVSLPTLTRPSDSLPTSPETTIIAMMPAYSGNWMMIPAQPRAPSVTASM